MSLEGNYVGGELKKGGGGGREADLRRS